MIKNNKSILLFFICLIGTIIGLLVTVSLGAKNIDLATIWNSVFHYKEELNMQLVRDIRIPRAICAVLVGGLLGMTGAMMQGVTRNPIAEPSLMGVTQGAVLAIAILYAVGEAVGTWSTMGAAFCGAMVSGLLVLLFSTQNSGNRNISRLVLAGTALSTFFLSLASAIALLSNMSQNLAFWVSGGFRTSSWSKVVLLVIVTLIGGIGTFFLAPRINIVSLGEETAIGLGENPGKVRTITLLLMIPICAACVAVAGNIGFVGLIIPQVVKKIVGQSYSHIIPCSFIMGAFLLVWADTAARMVNLPYETPVGLFTALIGVPFFLVLVRKEQG